MSITSMAGRLITVYRRSAFLVDGQITTAIPLSISIDRQPTAAGVVAVAVSGSPSAFGQVRVVGLVGGVPEIETLTFTAAGERRTINEFDAGSLSAFPYQDWGAGGTFTVRSLAVDGAPNHVSYKVVDGVRAHLNRGPARWPATSAGVAEVERTWFGIDYTTAWAPREGDVFVDEGSAEQWKVVGDPNWLGSVRPHHWEVRVVRHEGALDT